MFDLATEIEALCAICCGTFNLAGSGVADILGSPPIFWCALWSLTWMLLNLGWLCSTLVADLSQGICYVYFSESAVFWNGTSPPASVSHGYVIVCHMLVTGCNSPTDASVAGLVLLQCLAQIQGWETPHFLKWNRRLKSLLTELVESDTCNSFAGSLARYRHAFLVLTTVSGFVPTLRSCVQCSTCNNNNNNKNWYSEVPGKVILQALDKRWSVGQRAVCRLRGRSGLLKNMCSALNCHSNHSLIPSTRAGCRQD